MELIYLWIKDYKNINEIGIPLGVGHKEEQKAEFEFTKNELTINLSTANNYNVFGNYLNIKTFVGANGSGKSNITTALCYILRNGFKEKVKYDFEDYFDNSKPKHYCLIYKDNDSYQYISNCNKINLYIDNELQNLKKGEEITCGLFRPFLNIEDDTNLSFPKDVHIHEIVDRKIKNYFYYDRFRMYDTSQTLKNLFKENESKNFEILSGDNKYLFFDYYGYEIDIVQEFEWINRQLNNKIPLYFKKENIELDSKTYLVDVLTDSNNFIINKAKTDGYHDNKDFVNNVVTNGCFMFLLIKIAELFSMLKDYKNIISLKELTTKLGDMIDFVNNKTAQHRFLSLNEIDLKRKHQDLHDLYNDIKDEFEAKIQEQSIREQFDDNSYLEYFSELITSLVKFENDLLNNKCNLAEILTTENGNLFRLNKIEYLNSVNDFEYTEENLLLNSIGIFRRSYYKDKGNGDLYSFYDLSTGEQRLLRFFADILSLKDRGVAVYVFDEMDLSWHPEWQRKMVYYIKDFFDKCNSGYKNIIFTTHSPFILSDMPANNVVMLYRDSSGMSQIYQNTPNSFCANIHDLFNDNFFFNNCNGICTIGEVAKNHIENVKERIIKLSNYYKYNNLKNSDNFDFAVKVISLYNQIMIISEPVIRKSLLKEFMERYRYILFNNPARLAFDYVELRNKYDKLQKELNEKNKPER